MEDTPYSLAVEEARRAADSQADALKTLRSQVTAVVTIGALVATFLGGVRTGHFTCWTVLAIAAFVVLVVCAIVVSWPIKFYTSQKPSVLVEWVKLGATIEQQHRDLAGFMEGHYNENEERIKRRGWLQCVALIALMLELVFLLVDLRGR